MKGTSLVVLMATIFALGACGGDNNSNDNASNTTSGGTTATTGATGGESTSTTKKSKTQTTTTTPKKRSRKGTGEKGSGKSSGGSRTESQTTTTTTETPTTTTPTTPGEIPKPYDTAKKVCGAFLPLVTQRELDRGKRSKKSVARQYSRAWPEDQKKSAYKGCLAGLNARR
jgi:hypothetical protein